MIQRFILGDYVLVWGVFIVTLTFTKTQVTREETTQTCQTQTMNITCGLEEQIIVTAARFGRMEASSRCITGDYQTGCSENVIGLMDKHCSGWRTCEMLVPNDQLPSNACSIDLQKYLEVTYQCVRVRSITAECSRGGGLASAKDPEGYLPGVTLPSRGVPRSQPQCGWHITAQKGQLIQISLLNFHHSTTRDEGHQLTGCFDVAMVTEGADQEKTIKICHNRHQRRLTEVYTSQTRSVELRYTPIGVPSSHRYLIKYKAIGCPDIQPNVGMWARRTAADVTMIKCNHSEETWYVTCEGQQWKGSVGNCTNYDSNKKGIWSANEQTSTEESFPYGILITVAIGVALGIFFGGILLAIVTVIRRRRNYANAARRGCNLNSPSHPVNRHPGTLTSSVGGHTIDKGYLPIMDDRGQFPAAVGTDIYPITAHIHQPGCPQLQESLTQADGTTITRTPVGLDIHKIEPLYALHPTEHRMYDSTCVPVSHCHT